MHSLPVNVDWLVTNALSAIIVDFFFHSYLFFKRTFEETTVFNFLIKNYKFAMSFYSRDLGPVDIG